MLSSLLTNSVEFAMSQINRPLKSLVPASYEPLHRVIAKPDEVRAACQPSPSRMELTERSTRRIRRKRSERTLAEIFPDTLSAAKRCAPD